MSDFCTCLLSELKRTISWLTCLISDWKYDNFWMNRLFFVSIIVVSESSFCSSPKPRKEIWTSCYFEQHLTAFVTSLMLYILYDAHRYTQSFNGLLSGTDRMRRHKKKPSPTHTHEKEEEGFAQTTRFIACELIPFTIWYDTRCYFNVRSKADISQLNLPHGTDN